jgi:hypothetical protein
MTNTLSEKDIEIFCSYAQKDRTIFQRLELEFQLLRRRGQIADWYGSNDFQSQKSTKTVVPHLDSAHIILLLVSADFLASDYLYEAEVMQAWEKHLTGKARVIPVILRPVDWRLAPFGKLYCLPTGGTPVRDWPNQDEAISDIIRGIQMVIKELTT